MTQGIKEMSLHAASNKCWRALRNFKPSVFSERFSSRTGLGAVSRSRTRPLVVSTLPLFLIFVVVKTGGMFIGKGRPRSSTESRDALTPLKSCCSLAAGRRGCQECCSCDSSYEGIRSPGSYKSCDTDIVPERVTSFECRLSWKDALGALIRPSLIGRLEPYSSSILCTGSSSRVMDLRNKGCMEHR